MGRYFCWVGFVAAICSHSAVAADEIDQAVRNSVFKIEVKQRYPSPMEPWNKQATRSSAGTGFLVEGGRILTNNHVVEFATQVYVQPDQSDQQWKARVVATSAMMDLALLELEDSSKVEGREPISLRDSRPAVRSEVTVYGYPVGGDRLSVTKGIVSRLEYKHVPPFEVGLRTQIDAAINPGNSGGPALSENQIVGVASSRLRESDNIGYLVPSTEVQMFLDDANDGQVEGVAVMWDRLTTVENDSLRRMLKLPDNVGGMRVLTVRTVGEDYPLQEGDVIIRIGENAIDQKGDVRVDGDLRLDFHYYCPLLAEDRKVPLTIWRDGKELEVMVPLNPHSPDLLRGFEGEYPEYAFFGPLPFMAASREASWLAQSNEDLRRRLSLDGNPLITLATATRKFDDQQLVVIPAAPFPHPMMKGYTLPLLDVVESINGVEVRNLKHLVEIFRDCDDEFIEIQFAGIGSESFVFDRAEMMESTEEILTDNNIRNQFSDAMQRVWDGD